MENREDQYVECRYYEMPMGRYNLALLGEEWVHQYGNDSCKRCCMLPA